MNRRELLLASGGLLAASLARAQSGREGDPVPTKVLAACKDYFSRDNILRQAASLKELKLPLLLPGITVSTGPDDYPPFQQLRLRRFNGKNWIGFGELIDDRQV